MLIFINKSICGSKFQSKANTHHIINNPTINLLFNVHVKAFEILTMCLILQHLIQLCHI